MQSEIITFTQTASPSIPTTLDGAYNQFRRLGYCFISPELQLQLISQARLNEVYRIIRRAEYTPQGDPITTHGLGRVSDSNLAFINEWNALLLELVNGLVNSNLDVGTGGAIYILRANDSVTPTFNCAWFGGFGCELIVQDGSFGRAPDLLILRNPDRRQFETIPPLGRNWLLVSMAYPLAVLPSSRSGSQSLLAPTGSSGVSADRRFISIPFIHPQMRGVEYGSSITRERADALGVLFRAYTHPEWAEFYGDRLLSSLVDLW